MPLHPEQLKQLFQKLLQGAASEEEKAQLATYLQQDGKEIDFELLLPLHQWAGTEGNALPAGLRERVMDRILPANSASSHAPVPVLPLKKIKARWFYAAAAALIILFAGYWMVEQITGTPRWQTIAATNGELKIILLPDGTKVYLNAGSQLTYPEKFAGSKRPVQLTGEAFFEVAHDAARPFIVQSENVHTTVIGTAFNVQAYAGDSTIAVTVSNGKVKVEADVSGHSRNSILLTPGLRGVFGKNEKSFSIMPADTLAVAGWKEHRLVFENQVLGEIFKVLGKQHNVVFKAAIPALLSCTYSVTFDQLSLDESLNKLMLLGNLRFEHQGNTIVVTGEPCL